MKLIFVYLFLFICLVFVKREIPVSFFFTAKSAGAPFLGAYLNLISTFSGGGGGGVNFAVGGATALPVNVLAQRNIFALSTNSSLSVQLDWMTSYFNRLCNNATGICN